MRDLGLLLNVVAVAASLAALTISSILAVRQHRTARNANQLPVVVELLREIRSSETYGKELFLQEELPKQDPSLGFSKLPEPLRSYAYEVGGYYLMLGYLVLLEILDERLAILPVHYRAAETWRAMKPFVEGERSLRGDQLSFMNVLEAFIAKVEGADIAVEVEKMQQAFGVRLDS